MVSLRLIISSHSVFYCIGLFFPTRNEPAGIAPGFCAMNNSLVGVIVGTVAVVVIVGGTGVAVMGAGVIGAGVIGAGVIGAVWKPVFGFFLEMQDSPRLSFARQPPAAAHPLWPALSAIRPECAQALSSHLPGRAVSFRWERQRVFAWKSMRQWVD